VTGNLLNVYDDMSTGGAGGGQRRWQAAWIRFRVWVGALRGERSGKWRAQIRFRVQGGINRRGHADWAVPFVGRAAQRALTDRSNHVTGRAT
jgi:hypothetical protein